MKWRRIVWFVMVLSGGLWLIQCNVDHGLEVEDPLSVVRHGIRGRIIFQGPWPENVAEARVVVAQDFPPDPANPLQQFVFSDPIRVGVDTLDYALTLDPGVYHIIAVIFREKGKSWDISNILAVYSHLPGVFGFLFPDSVVVASDTTLVRGVDLTVDLTLGSLSGTVTFVGKWPENATLAGVGVFKNPLPVQAESIPVASLFSVKGVSLLPANISSVPFKIRVPPGSYKGINVLVILSLDPLDVRSIGRYEPAAGPSSPGVVVQQAQDTPGVDITADLNLIK